MKLDLTKLESDILLHRLEVPECIAEALDFDAGCVEVVCRSIINGQFDKDNELAKAVLKEAVEGSTYYSASEGSFPAVSEAKLRQIKRAGLSLASKLEKLLNCKIEFPLY